MSTLDDAGHTSWGGRAPLVIAATIPLVVLMAVPWRAEKLGAMPGFAPVWLALLVGCHLLTVVLLLDQYRAGGSARLLPLSWAYLWAAGANLELAVALPGVFSDDPTFAADPNSLQWLWVSSQLVPALLIGLALAPWPPSLGRRFAAQDVRGIWVAITWVQATLGNLLVGLVVGHAPDRLPEINDGDTLRLGVTITAIALVANVLGVALAVWGVARRRSNQGVESWAVVASVAYLGVVWLTSLDEAEFTISWYLARFLGLAASAFIMLAILRDTARVQARTIDTARRLEEQNAALVEANRLRDHLTAVVSHDMRTPLAGLQGYLEMLRDDDLDSHLARRMLERTWMLTRRLTLLTEDLLAAATLEHGDLVVTPKILDLNQQLAECASCFPDLDVELACPPGLAAYADPLRLQQILANLARNAQKHGAEPVLVAASADPERPGGVVIRVSDAGAGVPADFVPRLFDRYTQGSPAATATGGSGLGLSVVRDLVVAHDGTVHYDLVTNTFVLTLPPAPAAADPAVLALDADEPAAPLPAMPETGPAAGTPLTR